MIEDSNLIDLKNSKQKEDKVLAITRLKKILKKYLSNRNLINVFNLNSDDDTNSLDIEILKTFLNSNRLMK